MRIKTWNICLGLVNKRGPVIEYLKSSNISVCSMQETEIPSNFPIGILNRNGFNLELESCELKCRTSIYLKSNISHVRRNDLENNNCHVVIVDINCSIKLRIVNVYRSFHPPDGSSATEFFNKQLAVIKNALCYNCNIMGDFNLDGGTDLRPD